MDAPCKGCLDRTVTPNCHATCEAYLAYRAERDFILQARKAAHAMEDYAHDRHKPAEQSMFEMQRRGIK